MRACKLAGLLALLALGACSAQPFEYHSEREIPRGPGLFTGEDGVLKVPQPRVGAQSLGE